MTRYGALAGLWLGVFDGALALHRPVDLAGPWPDRLGVLAVAMLSHAVLLAACGALLGGLLGRRTPRAPGRAAGIATALAAGGAALGVAGPGWRGPVGPPADDPRPNVLLVSIDTLRADALGSYGYARPTSPRLDALAREGVRFENAYSHSSWTLPAHASALTGLDPFAHGVVLRDDRLADEFTTLTEQLRDAGYWTGAWVGTPEWGYLGARHGFDQGFALYRHARHPPRFCAALLPSLAARLLDRLRGHVGGARFQTDSVIGWLRGARREPFFLFVHYYDVHSKFTDLPYEAVEPFRGRLCPDLPDDYTGCRQGRCATERLLAMARRDEPLPDAAEIERLRCLYDGGVAYVDHEIGRLLDVLADEDLARRTLVVVTSDHGEAFFEHGMPLHVTLHDEILRIPLIVRLPGGAAGKRALGVARLIDLAPTILEIAGIEPHAPLQGHSLAEVLRHWPATREGAVLAADHRSGSTALQSGRAKLILNGKLDAILPPVQQFDLATDPEETRGGLEPVLLGELESMRADSEALGTRIASRRGKAATLGADEEKALRALGYAD